MKSKPVKGRALKPDPNQSLFKFKLMWAENHGLSVKNQTWYSYDYGCERQMFPFGIDKELRLLWKKLLSLCQQHQELYDIIKWLRPHPNGHILELYLPGWPETVHKIHLVESTSGWQPLETYIKQIGYEDFALRCVDKKYPRQAGHSPARTDFKNFYGFKYIHRNNFIVNSLSEGKLLKIDVYDNLIYNEENYLHTLWGKNNQNLAPNWTKAFER